MFEETPIVDEQDASARQQLKALGFVMLMAAFAQGMLLRDSGMLVFVTAPTMALGGLSFMAAGRPVAKLLAGLSIAWLFFAIFVDLAFTFAAIPG